MCSFWRQRIYIEKLIDNREFEKAKQKINGLRKNAGLEKKYSKYISSLDRKIKTYRISLILSKFIVMLIVGIVVVVAHVKDILDVKNSIQVIIDALWIINAGVIVLKSKRRSKLFFNTLFLLLNYGVSLLVLWCANSHLDTIPFDVLAVALPVVCAVLLLVSYKNIKWTKIAVCNIGAFIALIAVAISIQYFWNSNENHIDDSVNEEASYSLDIF